MCLEKIGLRKVAEEDILVYKVVRYSRGLAIIPEDGKDFEGVIQGISVRGKVKVTKNNDVFLCTNDLRFDGKDTEYKHGY